MGSRNLPPSSPRPPFPPPPPPLPKKEEKENFQTRRDFQKVPLAHPTRQHSLSPIKGYTNAAGCFPLSSIDTFRFLLFSPSPPIFTPLLFLPPSSAKQIRSAPNMSNSSSSKFLDRRLGNPPSHSLRQCCSKALLPPSPFAAAPKKSES